MTTEETPKVRRLAPPVVKELELKNAARRDAGLREIRVKVRTCLACGRFFESMGNRTCGCLAPRGTD